MNSTPSSVNASILDQQLREQRRTVDFDTFDIHIQQLLTMLDDSQISVAPAYQRLFRWNNKQCSQLIESLFLGIPVPSLFMATNSDNTWEVVDGVQRLSSIVKFAGSEELREKLKVDSALTLSDLGKLKKFNDLQYKNLPSSIQLHFRTRPLKVITLNDKSDKVVRYDLFERVNTGGVALSEQEIRDCVFQGEFADFLERLSLDNNFQKFLKLTPLQQRDGTAKECILRFFAFLDNYKNFIHSVKDFLNSYMERSSSRFNYKDKEQVFHTTFTELAHLFPQGLSRHGRKGTTPLNLFEGISVGAALALRQTPKLSTRDINQWMASHELKKYTTGATNSRTAVEGRIHFCRDRFLGIKYVPSTKDGN